MDGGRKVKQQITLEGSELRAIVAKALKVPEKMVVQLRYSIAVEGMSAEDVEKRLKEFLTKGEQP